MSLHFKVVDLQRYQHYRHRSPPWIKLYNRLLEDYAFGRLPDAGKAHLVAIWLLASRSGNCMPLDAGWVGMRINATETVDLDALRDAGFIEMLADCKQNGVPEREGETETEGERDILSDPPAADADHHRSKSKVSKNKKTARRKSGTKTYPDAFDAFWRDYPADPIMSKLRAFAQWEKLGEEDRKLAHDALAPFRAHCARDLTYRPVHAERFLSQRRFDGFAAGRPPPDAAVKAMWDGAAAPLVEAIGAASFQAYFAEATFEPGPPPRIRFAKTFLRERVQEKFAAALARAFGQFELSG